MVVSSGGWHRLRSFLEVQKDATKPWWRCLRFKNAWYGLVSRFWMCQLIFFKPFVGLITAAYHEIRNDYGKSKFASLMNLIAGICTVVPLIGIAMFNYTLTKKDMIAFEHTTSKVTVLRVLTPVTQFVQTIFDLMVARGSIVGNDEYTAIELGNRMISFVLSLSMLFVSILTLWAYRPSDFDEISPERLDSLSMQRYSVDVDTPIEIDDGNVALLGAPGDQVSVSHDAYERELSPDLGANPIVS